LGWYLKFAAALRLFCVEFADFGRFQVNALMQRMEQQRLLDSLSKFAPPPTTAACVVHTLTRAPQNAAGGNFGIQKEAEGEGRQPKAC